MVHEFLKSLINQIFKMLPLKEEQNPYLKYIEGVLVQVQGAQNTYPVLKSNAKYISVMNTLQFFSCNEFTHTQCRQEVFRCIHTIEHLQSEVS